MTAVARVNTIESDRLSAQTGLTPRGKPNVFFQNFFTNLMDNALKYTFSGLTLDIRLAIKNRWVEVAFVDNGIGVPAEYRAKVFEPFFRVPRGNVHDVKGHGLGLNYVRQILRQHRGSVLISANEPTGSPFIVKLPLL